MTRISDRAKPRAQAALSPGLFREIHWAGPGIFRLRDNSTNPPWRLGRARIFLGRGLSVNSSSTGRAAIRERSRRTPPGFGVRQPSAAFSASVKSASPLPLSPLRSKAPEGWRTPRRWRDTSGAVWFMVPRPAPSGRGLSMNLRWGETLSNPDFFADQDSRARQSLAPPLDGFMAPMHVQSLDAFPFHEPRGTGAYSNLRSR